MRKNRTPSRQRTVYCKICEKPFLTSHSQGKYCSYRCRRKGHDELHKKYERKEGVADRIDAYRKKYYVENAAKIRLRVARYRETEAGKRALKVAHRNTREKFPERVFARQAVKIALRNGTLKRLPCRDCGKKKVQAHHPDYSKPLEVVWLCKDDHWKEHKRLKDL